MLSFRRFPRTLLTAMACAGALAAQPGQAAPSLVIDAQSGAILHQQEATASWYPASLTKLMTAYVALKAVRDGRITLETPMLVSARAARMAPSKMGFKPGTEVMLENALVMIMVKSANDISVTIAEGVSGSVEAFAAEMNAAARSLGMTQSQFRNPNGLPDREQVTSARDMAILALALHREFPDQKWLWGIGAMQLGPRYYKTHNGLMGRYPGADGMKTGFTCAAGFNVVASSSRFGRQLITVVMGATSARERTALAAELFEKGFNGASAQGLVTSLPGPGIMAAEDQRQNVCMRRGRNAPPVAESEEDLPGPVAAYASGSTDNPALEMLNPSRRGGALAMTGTAIAAQRQPHFDPVIVHVGRKEGWTGPVAGPAGTGAVAAVRSTQEEGAEPVQLQGARAKPALKAKKPMKASVAAVPPKAEKAKTPAAKAAAKTRDAGPVKAQGQPESKGKPKAGAAAKPAPGKSAASKAKSAAR